ncbi:MAG TPA: hypothetical protein VHM24_03010, partial [Gemmatimonadaceae bacterium]|nr:hypothetical protein [Gemmatimonadaceae bacterium]
IRLTDAQYSDVLRHAASTLSGSSSDLTAVLTHADRGGKGTRSLGAAIGRLAEAQKAMGAALGSALKANESSAESAGTMTEYASTDDPEMILMALRGAKNISSDTDRRTLLETLAPRALRRINPTMRTAFFEAAAVTESDTDRRAILLAALRFAQGDKKVALAVFQLVAKMTSDTDKRAVLSKAAEQRLLSTAELRAAFMNAAKTIESSTDYTAVMQAALRL